MVGHKRFRVKKIIQTPQQDLRQSNNATVCQATLVEYVSLLSSQSLIIARVIQVIHHKRITVLLH